MYYIQLNQHLPPTPDDMHAIAIDIEAGKTQSSFPVEWSLVSDPATRIQELEEVIEEKDEEIDWLDDIVDDLEHKIDDLEDTIKIHEDTIADLKAQL